MHCPGVSSQTNGCLIVNVVQQVAHLILPRPLPRVEPRAIPLARPLPAGAPRPAMPPLATFDGGAGVENLEETFEEVGGFSTKDVSVVLCTS